MDTKEFEQNLKELNNIFYQQNEREKEMALAGSIQQKSEVAASKLQEINNLINEYNQKGAEILMRKESGEFKNYTPEYVQSLVKQETENHLANYLKKTQEFLDDTLTWLKISINQKSEIRFPYRSSKDIPKGQLGEMKSLRAQNFVINSNLNPNIIMSELFNAFRSNDDDYFNSLVDSILINEPENEFESSELQKTKPELVELFNKVRNLYKEFSSKNNLQILGGAIISLTTIATESSSLLAAIKGGSIYYFPKRMAEKMDQNEVARNLEMINASMPFWGTKLEGLNFVHEII